MMKVILPVKVEVKKIVRLLKILVRAPTRVRTGTQQDQWSDGRGYGFAETDAGITSACGDISEESLALDYFQLFFNNNGMETLAPILTATFCTRLAIADIDYARKMKWKKYKYCRNVCFLDT